MLRDKMPPILHSCQLEWSVFFFTQSHTVSLWLQFLSVLPFFHFNLNIGKPPLQWNFIFLNFYCLSWRFAKQLCADFCVWTLLVFVSEPTVLSVFKKNNMWLLARGPHVVPTLARGPNWSSSHSACTATNIACLKVWANVAIKEQQRFQEVQQQQKGVEAAQLLSELQCDSTNVQQAVGERAP